MPGGARRPMLRSTATKEDRVTVATSNAAMIEEGYSLFAAGDIEGVFALFSPEIVWTIPGPKLIEGEYRGHAELAGFFAKLQEAWQSQELELEHVLGEGDVVVALGRHHIGLNDRTYVVPFAHAWRVVDGLAVSFREYTDTAEFERMLAA